MKWSILALLLFALLSAGRDVCAKVLFKNTAVSPLFLTWLCCSVTLFSFYVKISVTDRALYAFRDFVAAPRRIRWRFLALNVCTLIAFLTSLMAIDYLDAYLNATIDYGANPIIAACLAVWLRNERLGPGTVLGMLVSLVGVLLLFAGQSRIDSNSIVGALLAVVSCIALGLVLVWNKDVIESGVLRERAIVTRLPLAVVALGLICVFTNAERPMVSLVWLILWSFFGVSIPLLLLAFAFERLQVKHAAVFMFLIPVFTLIGCFFTNSLTGSIASNIIGGTIVLLGVIVAENAAKFQAWFRPRAVRSHRAAIRRS